MMEDFASLITASQQRMYGYIYSLLGSSAASWDVLQETNLVLWRKQGDFLPGTSFEAWAFSVARFQVLAHLRDRKREPICVMTPELMEAFGEEVEVEASALPDRLIALRRCREQLGVKSRRLVALHYDEGKSLNEVGAALGMNGNAVKQALFRVRRTLLDCIEAVLPA